MLHVPLLGVWHVQLLAFNMWTVQVLACGMRRMQLLLHAAYAIIRGHVAQRQRTDLFWTVAG